MNNLVFVGDLVLVIALGRPGCGVHFAGGPACGICQRSTGLVLHCAVVLSR